jgi:hypothetical protein
MIADLCYLGIIRASFAQLIVKIRNKMKKSLSLIILIACGSNSYAIDTSKVYAYADLVKAKTSTLLAEAKIAALNSKDKIAGQLAELKDKINGIEKPKIKSFIDVSKETTNSLIATAKEHPNACIAVGVSTACLMTYWLYKKCSTKSAK